MHLHEIRKEYFEEFKIIFRGRAFWIRAKEAPGWVPDFMEENDDEERNDDGGFNVHESSSCGDKQENHSGDPFSIYKLLKKKKDNVEMDNNSEHSMKYPPCFTPKEGTDVVGMHAEESRSDNIVNLSDHNVEEVNNTFSGYCPRKNSKEDISNSVCSGHFKTSMVPRTGGSILSLMDELVKVGQVRGYKMDRCMSNMTEIIKSQGVKEMLWDYLTYEIGKWKGEVVIMGDFNEVWYKSDRFGSMFNVQGANVFNSFITNARLEEVPLGGSSFTCDTSYHRPILLRESHFDYEPTPFRFFHHWIEMEGFIKVVEDAWREGPSDESNAMINMMIKLKHIKTKIREWNKKNMLSAKNVKAKYKDELEALEAIIDKGDGNVEVVNKRMEVVNTLQKIDKICSSEMAQKAKVKWSIEGDENTSFFHVHVLECFYRASGLRINMSKSKIMGVLVDSDKSIFKGQELNSKKASCVNWKKVLTPKEKGGLGVSSLYALNRGLMFKWMWRFYTQNTSLWVRVIKAIHGDDGKVGGYVKVGAKSCWLSIVNEINSLKNKGINLLDFMHVKLGNGDKTAFWEDIWIEDFSVASVRKVIDDKSFSKVDSKTRWIKYVPIKVNVHAWKVKTDSLPTRFNVSRRGIHIDSIMCAICAKWAETSSHLFFSCCMARQTVRMITRWWDVPCGEVDSYEDWINWFVNLRLSYKHKQMLEDVFYVK
uniref:RNA-directed DNA polymerase, eukaryota, reverse transcriptase zinc-binding domain protein n=1 Tax=Tanacetum cinerariifolium TaxID=118510 RepID=A0A6L2KAH4_TANCI|nr:RNA-directed DNA polymerase, eukaryota, reverse transcriptase zinc-binding domain protein [Tanacetum cinerariifolium]